MSIIRSLICWGGKTGFSAAAASILSISSPCVVTIANHGIRQYNGGTTPMTKGIIFSTNGALPTGITAGTTYWARRIDDNTFHLYDTEAHALNTGSTTGRINTSGSQSGTHTAKGSYYMSLSTADKAPYIQNSVEYIYNGLLEWISERVSAGVLRTNVEQCEIAEAFTEYKTSQLTMANMITAYNVITTKINGVRSAAFHAGTVDKGYIFKTNISYDTCCNFNRINTEVDGVQFNGIGYYGFVVSVSAPKQHIHNCLIRGVNNEDGNIAIRLNQVSNTINNNIVLNAQWGIVGLDYSGSATVVSNNVIARCGIGLYSQGEFHDAFYYNNISIGNTTSYGGVLTRIPAAINNAGPSGSNPWSIPAGSSVTVETSDFIDYADNDFRPAFGTSPQVASGFNIYGGEEFDIIGRVRPSWYEDNGSWLLHDNWSIGPYEYNFGDPPVQYTFTISSQNGDDLVDAQISIYDADGTIPGDMGTEIYEVNNSASSSVVYSHSGNTNSVYVQVIKPGYVEQVILFTLLAENQTIFINLQADNNE